MKKRPSLKQLNYARGIMDESKTKQQAALDAGYSFSTSRVPKMIENKQGFSFALDILASETSSVYMKALHELKSRDLSQEDTKTILGSIEILSRTFDRFIPKNKTREGEENWSDLKKKVMAVHYSGDQQ